MTDLAATIDAAWEDRANISLATTGAVRDAVAEALNLLDSGEARVAEPVDGGWQVNQWLKKAVLLSFRLNDNAVGHGGFDKVPLKTAGWDDARFRQAGFRQVPGSVVRHGAHIGRNVVLMPSFVN
ncbi:MAG: 2,3,4,5-tetrahydropyridine-2,6-dicarboxylate N-succinyltransferase, partial [Sphingomonas sp.]